MINWTRFLTAVGLVLAFLSVIAGVIMFAHMIPVVAAVVVLMIVFGLMSLGFYLALEDYDDE